jgi:chromosome segregation ATPase
VICCVSPAAAFSDETKSVLMFASRAKNITTSCSKNELMTDDVKIRLLARQLADEQRSHVMLQQEMASYSDNLAVRDARIAELQTDNADVKQQLQAALAHVQSVTKGAEAALADRDAVIANLQRAAAEAAESITTVSNDYASARDRIAALETELARRDDAAREHMSTMSQHIDVLKSELAAAQASAQSSAAELEALRSSGTDKDATVSKLLAEMSTVQSQRSELEATLQSMQGELQSAQEQVSDLLLDNEESTTRASQLQSQLEAAEAALRVAQSEGASASASQLADVTATIVRLREELAASQLRESEAREQLLSSTEEAASHALTLQRSQSTVESLRETVQLLQERATAADASAAEAKATVSALRDRVADLDRHKLTTEMRDKIAAKFKTLSDRVAELSAENDALKKSTARSARSRHEATDTKALEKENLELIRKVRELEEQLADAARRTPACARSGSPADKENGSVGVRERGSLKRASATAAAPRDAASTADDTVAAPALKKRGLGEHRDAPVAPPPAAEATTKRDECALPKVNIEDSAPECNTQ